MHVRIPFFTTREVPQRETEKEHTSFSTFYIFSSQKHTLESHKKNNSKHTALIMPRVTTALLAVAAASSAAAGASDPQLAALYTGPVNPQSVCNSGLKPTGWTQTFSLSPAVSGGGLGLSYSATSNVAFAQGDIIVAGGNSPSAYKCNQISIARNMDLALVAQGNVTGKYKQCRSQTGTYKGKFDPSLLCGLCRSTDTQQASPAPQCPIVVVGDSEVSS